MSDESNDGFLGRWSRRKAHARAGQPLAEPPPPAVPAAAGAGVPDAVQWVPDTAPAPVDTAQAAAENEAAALTLDDVKSLTLESDFQPFVARSVAPEVRNAAFKKLFTDPHFNVMDGLDIYIDDYTQPDPLPASMLAQMASARFLKLVDEPQEEAVASAAGAPTLQECEQAAGADAAPTADSAATAAAPEPGPDSADVAPSAPCNELPLPQAADAGAAPRHDDADLRLQSHDAAGRAADRPGAG